MAKESWYSRNKERALEMQRKRIAANPGPRNAYALAWARRNPEKRKAAIKKYALNNRAKITETKKRWLAKRPDYWKDRNAKNPYRKYKRFGLDLVALAAEQENKCAICAKETARLCVDHCHKKDIFRGLLCRECNAGLGSFYDNPAFLESAIQYLKHAS